MNIVSPFSQKDEQIGKANLGHSNETRSFDAVVKVMVAPHLFLLLLSLLLA